MPANLPSPIVGAGGQGSRGLPEQLLLTLASAAPGMLMQFLNQRQQSADINAQGEASTHLIVDMVRNGTLSPDLFRDVGGSYTPSQTVQGVTAPSGLQTPTISTQPRVGAGSINPRVAPQVLQQLMTTQQAQSNIEASRAQTAAVQGQEARETELQPLRIEQIRSGIATNKFTQQMERRRMALAEKGEARQAGNEAERIGIERERLQLARSEALQDVNTRLSALYSDQFARFTSMAQLYAQAGLAPDAAKARASADVWRTTKPPTLDEFVSQNTERATAGILTAQGADPDAAMLKTMFGDRPDVEYAQSIGVSPEQVEFINQQLEVADGDGGRAFSAVSGTIPLEGDAKDAELAKILLYISFKTGTKVDMPPAEKSRLRRALESIVGSSEDTGMKNPIGGLVGFGQRIGQGLAETAKGAVEVTPEQRQQMDSGFITGWAPPAR